MILRIQKRESPYVQIDKRPLEDPRISWRAKGILAYLLSKPDGWSVRMENVLKHGTEGRDAVASAMKELQSAGYAWIATSRNPDGSLAGKTWIISEEPRCPEKPVISGTDALKNRQSEKPIIGESAASNNNLPSFPRKNEERESALPKVVDSAPGTSPTLEMWQAACSRYSVPSWYAELHFRKLDDTGWRRGATPLLWQKCVRTVATYFENDGRPMKPGMRAPRVAPPASV